MQKMERVYHHTDDENMGGGIQGAVVNTTPHLADDLSAVEQSASIPSKERAERFVVTSSLGKDVFTVENGVLITKGPQDSEVMKGHLGCGLPLVPGVVQLSALTSGIDTKGKVKHELGSMNPVYPVHGKSILVHFLKPILPGYKVVIRDNELHKYHNEGNYGENTQVAKMDLSDLDLAIREEAHSKLVEAHLQDSFVALNKTALDDYLLQEGAFRFVDGVTANENVQAGDEFFGFWHVPQDIAWAKDNKVDPAILVESVAQMGSRFFGPSLNKGKSLRNDNVLDMDAKLLTFGSSHHQTMDVEVKPGDTIYVYGKIYACSNASVEEKNEKRNELRKIERNLGKRSDPTYQLPDTAYLVSQANFLQVDIDAMQTSSKFDYLIVNQNGECVLKGIIAGDTMKAGTLKTMVERAMR